MVFDTPRHFAIERLRSGHIDHLQAALARVSFRQRALARAGAANDQFSHAAKISMTG